MGSTDDYEIVTTLVAYFQMVRVGKGFSLRSENTGQVCATRSLAFFHL